jgi:hypothetical protein
MAQVDDDMDGIRPIHGEEFPRQPQEVHVVAIPFGFSLLEDNSNRIFGLPAVIPTKDGYRSHRYLLLSSSFNLQADAL